MSAEIKKCCNVYTLKDTCQTCGKTATSPAPAKYSPEDKYASYRRKYKEQYGE